MDVALAVWMSDLENLKSVQKAHARALNKFQEERQFGVAHHQADVFILEPGTNRYLGRLCLYGKCPKDKRECLVPDCGRFRFLQQFVGFRFYPDALADEAVIVLYDRQTSLEIQ